MGEMKQKASRKKLYLERKKKEKEQVKVNEKEKEKKKRVERQENRGDKIKVKENEEKKEEEWKEKIRKVKREETESMRNEIISSLKFSQAPLHDVIRTDNEDDDDDDDNEEKNNEEIAAKGNPIEISHENFKPLKNSQLSQEAEEKDDDVKNVDNDVDDKFGAAVVNEVDSYNGDEDSDDDDDEDGYNVEIMNSGDDDDEDNDNDDDDDASLHERRQLLSFFDEASRRQRLPVYRRPTNQRQSSMRLNPVNVRHNHSNLRHKPTTDLRQVSTNSRHKLTRDPRHEPTSHRDAEVAFDEWSSTRRRNYDDLSMTSTMPMTTTPMTTMTMTTKTMTSKELKEPENVTSRNLRIKFLHPIIKGNVKKIAPSETTTTRTVMTTTETMTKTKTPKITTMTTDNLMGGMTTILSLTGSSDEVN